MARSLTITYVTDPALDDERQREVVRALMSAADEHTLRIAFRLPDASVETVAELLEWYLVEANGKGLLPPLVHNRPRISSSFPQVRSWLPSRLLGSGVKAEVWSVHSFEEAMQARAHGASEVVFGHVFNTESHPGESGRGVDHVRRIATIPGLNVTAIGGINERSINAIEVDSIACIRAISRSRDIAGTLRTMSKSWKGKKQ